MKHQILLMVLLAVLFLAFSCRKHAVPVPLGHVAADEVDVAAIKHAIDRWTQLYNAGDYDTLMSTLYTAHAVLMAPNVPISKGREEILRGYQRDAELSDEHVDSSVIEDVRVSGDMAVVRGSDMGTSTRKGVGKPVKYSLKWLIVMERQLDSTWKIIYEIWNDNNPGPNGEGT